MILWIDVVSTLWFSMQAAKKIKTGEKSTPEQWRYEVVFEHCYPRLDVNVSKGRNHLLKSPFGKPTTKAFACLPVYAARFFARRVERL